MTAMTALYPHALTSKRLQKHRRRRDNWVAELSDGDNVARGPEVGLGWADRLGQAAERTDTDSMTESRRRA